MGHGHGSGAAEPLEAFFYFLIIVEVVTRKVDLDNNGRYYRFNVVHGVGGHRARRRLLRLHYYMSRLRRRLSRLQVCV
jgi:hypothetical protein